MQVKTLKRGLDIEGKNVFSTGAISLSKYVYNTNVKLNKIMLKILKINQKLFNLKTLLNNETKTMRFI